MTTYGAYDAGLPCKNRACKSHGRPHPNCQCYGDDMAEGGEVKSFCDSDRAHKEDCEYFAGGGEVPQDDMPDELAMPEAEPTPTPESLEVPEYDIPEEYRSNIVPEDDLPDHLKDKSAEYQTTGQKVLTAVEGLGQGFLGPLMTGAELGLSKLGVPGLSEEDIKARQAANPEIYTASEVAGIGAGFVPVLAPFSLAGKIGKAASAAKIGMEATKAAQLGGAVLRGAIQGGMFQASDEITKAMLGQGDPNEAVAAKVADGALNIFASGAASGVLGGFGIRSANT